MHSDPVASAEAWKKPSCVIGLQKFSLRSRGAIYKWASLAGLKGDEVRSSMDGKGCWGDNVLVGRLWCSVKCEDIDFPTS